MGQEWRREERQGREKQSREEGETMGLAGVGKEGGKGHP